MSTVPEQVGENLIAVLTAASTLFSGDPFAIAVADRYPIAKLEPLPMDTNGDENSFNDMSEALCSYNLSLIAISNDSSESLDVSTHHSS
jgi:hypothetical protein